MNQKPTVGMKVHVPYGGDGPFEGSKDTTIERLEWGAEAADVYLFGYPKPLPSTRLRQGEDGTIWADVPIPWIEDNVFLRHLAAAAG